LQLVLLFDLDFSDGHVLVLEKTREPEREKEGVNTLSNPFLSLREILGE